MFCAGISLLIISIMARPALVVLIMTARQPSAIPIRKLWKNKGLLLTGLGSYTAHLRPHSEVVRGERMRERKGESQCPRAHVGLGFCFYWDWGWGPRISWAHSLLANLKCRSGNLKHGKIKNKWPKWSVIEINQDL